MDGKTLRRTVSWKPALLLLATASCVIIAISFYVVSLRNRNWERFESRVRELQSDIAEQPPLPRLPLGRSALPGNAWDDYVKAWLVSGSPRFPSNQALVRDFLARTAAFNRDEVDSLVSLELAQISLLKSGVRRKEAKLPAARLTINGLEFGALSRNGSPMDLIEVTTAKARLLSEEGKTDEALDLLIDLCIAGRDWAGARLLENQGNGLTAMDRSLCEIRETLQTLPTSEEKLKELNRAMALLDDYFPDTTGRLWDELLRLGELLIREDRDDEKYVAFSNKERSRRSWRFGFSSRLQAAAQFFTAEDLFRRELEIEKQPWSTACQANQELHQEKNRHPDPLISECLSGLLKVQWDIGLKGALRLIRVAAHYRATGEVLELKDPVQGLIRTRSTEGKLLIWKRQVLSKDGWDPPAGDKSYYYWNTIEVPKH